MKLNRQELYDKLEADVAESKCRIAALMEHELLDDDGYPTDEALQIVEAWHWTDAAGWFNFIHSIWHLASWGWAEGPTDHEYKKDTQVYRFDVSTAGWSGNESIIAAMQRNEMMWHLNWVQSRRGGHYIFELKEFHDDQTQETSTPAPARRSA